MGASNKLGAGQVRRFGDPLSESGAIYCFSDVEGFFLAQKEIARAEILADGGQITPEVERALERRRLEDQKRYVAEVRARGIPDDVRRLLRADKKKRVLKLARRISITSKDLADLIFNHGQDGWSYRSKHLELIPEHLRPSNSEYQALFANGVGPFTPEARKAASKVRGVFRERLHRSIHLFERGDHWHCFYFTYTDSLVHPVHGSNHWKGGTHVHYVSHLWPNLSAHDVWSRLDERRALVTSVHISYSE